MDLKKEECINNLDISLINLAEDYNENNINLMSGFFEDKFVFELKGKLPKNSNNYLQYFWDPENFKKANKNIINEIKIIDKKENYYKIESNFSINTKNIDIGNITKTEELMLEKKKDGFIVYSNIINNNDEDVKSIKNGYSIIKIIDFNEESLITITTIFESNVPKLFKKVLGILIVKSILNVLQYDK